MSNRILKLPEVITSTGLSRSSIYAFIKAGTFPAPVKLGVRAVGWYTQDIQDWLDTRKSSAMQGE